MKKPVSMFMVIVLFMLITHCKQRRERIVIGFLLKTLQEERYQHDKRVFIERAEELGVSVIFDAANNREDAQFSKLENMITKGCKVIVFQPVNTMTAGVLVRMAHKRGIRIVGYDSMVVNGPIDVMVMQDSWEVGRLQGKAMLDWFKKYRRQVSGNVVLIKGQPGDSNANLMSLGVRDIIFSNPGLTLVAERSHEGWSPAKAMSTAENILAKYHNNIDAFICNNSGMARGVIAALDNNGLADATKVFTAGADADLVNIRYVAQGKQTVDVWKKITPLAKKAAEVAVILVNNPDKKVTDLVKVDRMVPNGYSLVPTIITEVVLINKDTIYDTLIREGVYTRNEIYK